MATKNAAPPRNKGARRSKTGVDPLAKAGEKGSVPDKQEFFLIEYLKDSNGARAAKACGISDETAKTRAYEWLCRADVKIRLARMREEQAAKTQWEIQDSRRELVAMALADIGDFALQLGNSFTLRDLETMPAEVRRCIKTIKMGFEAGRNGEVGTHYVKEIILHDKLTAIDMLNKHQGFYEKDNAQKSDAMTLLLEHLHRVQPESARLKVKS